jgi:hypothetical protein
LTVPAVVPLVVGALVAVERPLVADPLTVRPGLQTAANAMTVHRKCGVRLLRASPPKAGLSMIETAVVPGWWARVIAPSAQVLVLARCSSHAT